MLAMRCITYGISNRSGISASVLYDLDSRVPNKFCKHLADLGMPNLELSGPTSLDVTSGSSRSS